ncbi:L-histidine N(alpha)-methyltransferase [Aliikangiella marina]|uniref:L-histidine N(Alpha)-methyltransferase n=1 Tax=Aliikangiella marina TaxID=1712262 RepID=A0A545T722_9GAMM|nr:L-histidine N(alpha)-methyltransferase [Aliikangiella marina]TQV73020.1 L-histidine N(alpha)-methyltransferase [Aliikangiella marina]
MDVKVTELAETPTGFIDDVLEGLSKPQKTLPCKYFYDEVGSNLFESICDVDEYYITRTELQLLDDIKCELAQLIGPDSVIIEPGAGAGIKIQKLLAELTALKAYVPIDISSDFLFYSAEKIRENFSDIEIRPIQGDFTEPYQWTGKKSLTNRVVFFPGSTIGNFTPAQAEQFLKNQKRFAGKEGAMIIGVDLVKPLQKLESAYNDSQGVTAEFNKNLLVRINNELGGNFELDQFEHTAVFNPAESRIEMRLVSQQNQSVKINRQEFHFDEYEYIHTENSYKYTIEAFTALAERAGLKSHKVWTDDENLISLHYLKCR